MQPDEVQQVTLVQGDRCQVDGLKERPELNGMAGMVENRDVLTGRLIVSLDNGHKIAALTKNCHLMAAGETLPVIKEDCAYDTIVEPWAKRVKAEDPSGWKKAGSELYSYLIGKAKENSAKNGSGPAGWAFASAHPQCFVRAAIWSDGRSSIAQCQPYTGPNFGEQWWPCVVLDPAACATGHVGCTDICLPFMCPVLAIQGSRPWKAHPSRVRRVSRPQPAPPQSPPPYGLRFGPPSYAPTSEPITITDTPGPVIEEIIVEEEEDW